MPIPAHLIANGVVALAALLLAALMKSDIPVLRRMGRDRSRRVCPDCGTRCRIGATCPTCTSNTTTE